MSKENGPNYDYLFKIILVGNSTVGKTSLLMRFIDNSYTDEILTTIGIDFVSCKKYI